MKKDIAAFLEGCYAEFTAAGRKLDGMTMPRLTEELFSEYERTGNRISYESVYFLRRKFLSVYAVLAVFYGDESRTDRLESVIADICREECWALPAHVDRKNNSDWRVTVDLFAAETAFSLAEIAVLLRERISPELFEAVRREVHRRVLDPFVQNWDRRFGWEDAKNNWCAVCCGSVGGAAIYMMEDEAALDRLLDRVCSDLSSYIDGFGNDGGCLEGLGYYTYGMSFYTAFADLMYSRSEGRIDLMSGEKIRQIALFQQKCHLAPGAVISFSDSEITEQFRAGLTSYLAMRFEDVCFPDFSSAAGMESDNCYRYIVLSRDVMFARRYLDSAAGKEKNAADVHTASHTVLPDVQWSICTGEDGSAVAVKGGHNDEPHNHNDVGSFIYMYRGRQILTDLGAGEYTKEYFGSGRYDVLCCRSLGHNVPLVDGTEQRTGERFRASRFEMDGMGRTVIGLEQAYGLLPEERITRTVDFSLDAGECTVTDEFDLVRGRTAAGNLVTCLEPELRGDVFVIDAEESRFEIRCSGSKHRIISDRFRGHRGEEIRVWLMQWDVTDGRSEMTIRRV